MRSFAFIGLLALTHAAMASTTSPCDKSEYLQLKDADKVELQQEYCSAIRRAQLADRLHAITEETVAKKRAISVDASTSEKESLELIDVRTSCLVRAAKFKSALAKRFKSKPPASCD
jgi:hypothetical protein